MTGFTPALEYVGSLSQVGKTQIFGAAFHRPEGSEYDNLVYLEAAGPPTSIEAVWAALANKKTLTFVPENGRDNRYLRHHGLEESPTFLRFQQRLPNLQVDHMTLLDRRFEAIDDPSGLCFLFDEPGLPLKLAAILRRVVSVAIFPAWSERLVAIGQQKRLIVPLPILGQQGIYQVSLNPERWEYQIAQRVGKGELSWPGDDTPLQPLSEVPDRPEPVEVTPTGTQTTNKQNGQPVSQAMLDRRRGHELLTAAIRKRLPRLYGQEKLPVEEKKVHVKFFCGSLTWYAMEFDPKEERFFGWVENEADPMLSEYGYFSLEELNSIQMPVTIQSARDSTRVARFHQPVERDLHFSPKRLIDCPISLRVSPAEHTAAEENTANPPEPELAEPAPASPPEAPGYTLEHERGWSWLSFAEKPPQAVREAIKDLGFRWSNKRKAWYVKAIVEQSALEDLIP